MSQPVFGSADAAQDAFYAAFEAGDLDAMMAVWADDDVGVECIHPMSDRLTLREDIHTSWKNIFSSGARLTFNIRDVRRFDSDSLSVRLVHEEIRFGPRGDQRSVVIATNVYCRTGEGWLMVLHHGSPASPPQATEPPAATQLH